MKHIHWAALPMALAASAVLLAACGGGYDGDNNAGGNNVSADDSNAGAGGGVMAPTDPLSEASDVPASAYTSSAGAVAFVKSVVATSDNTSAPLRVGSKTLASSETDEPERP